jgi:excisionase family DNA binding protein
MQALKIEDEFLRAADAATLLGLDRRTIYRTIAREELRATRVGGQWFIRRSDIEAMLGGQR